MAEEYGKKETTVVTETKTVTTKPVREDGAEAFVNDKKGAFPWWLPLLLLLCIVPLAYFALHRSSPPDTIAAISPPPKKRANVIATAPVVATGTPEATAVAASADSAASANTPAAADTSATPPASGDAKVYSGKDIAVGSTAAASSQGEPLSDVTQFTGATDRATLIGRKVKLTNVKVLRVITDRAYFVGGSDEQKMLVLLDKGMDAGAGPQRVNIEPGGTVSLTGVLEKVPNPEIAQEQYGLSKPNFDAIGKEDVYLHATVAQKKDNLGK